MNKSYRVIWSVVTHTWVAVSEIVKAQGKRAGGTVTAGAPASATIGPVGVFPLKAIASYLLLSGVAHAVPPTNELPTGGTVGAGRVTIQQIGNTLNVNQSTSRAVINWSTFNVGRDTTVNFNQPSAGSVTLNRVQGGNPSQIFGHINANGQVFLSNADGVYFSPSASVNVGALVATTHGINDDEFIAGRYLFNRNGSTGSIVNEGSLTARLGGYVALLAPEVRNNGVIVAQLGTVALAAGEAYELQFDGKNLLSNIRVEPSTVQALVENGNAVHAPSGLIILSAQAVNRLQGGGIINNSGTLEATGFTSSGGVVRLAASDSITHTGTINVDAAGNSAGSGGTATLIASLDKHDSMAQINGNISARGGDLGGDGGFVETSGGRVQVGDSARVSTSAPSGKAGTWLLDPTDFTIAATGGNMTGATITANLAATDVTIESSGGTDGTLGNINVNDVVAWSDKQLTLRAQNNININANMTMSGSNSKLNILYGLGAVAAGNTSNIVTAPNVVVDLPALLASTLRFQTTQGSDGINKSYTVITALGAVGSTTKTDLQGISGGVGQNYALGSNIDASSTSSWNGALGFLPIASFSGTLDGLGHTISGLRIARTATTPTSTPCLNYCGLFLNTSNTSVIRNVGLVDGSVTGVKYVGFLVGYSGGSISNSYATGSVTGTYNIGGLVGSSTGTISNSYATGSVTGANHYIGGLVGETSGGGTISNSYATGSVQSTGGDNVGGLVGVSRANISNSYATGSVISKNGSAGGLVGSNMTGFIISNSYATGNVTSNGNTANTGGLVGSNRGPISNSYATGSVTGGEGISANNSADVGGLVGIHNSDSISNSYATGSVTGRSGRYVGGLVGEARGPISNSYATGSVTGSSMMGGFAGFASGTLSNNFWNTSTSGQLTGIYGRANTAGQFWGMNTANMQLQVNFTSETVANSNSNPNWDFTTPIWRIVPQGNSGYPCLSGPSCMPVAFIRLIAGGSSVYGEAPNMAYGLYSSSSGGGIISDALLSGSVIWSSSLGPTSSVSSWAEVYLQGLKSANYQLNAGSSVNWIINKKPLGLTVSKTYDGNAAFTTGFIFTGMMNGNAAPTITSGSASVTSSNVANYSSLSSNTLALSNANYTLIGGAVSATINKAAATVTANSDSSKTYTGTPQSVGGFTATGLVNGQLASVLTGVTIPTYTNAGTYTVIPAGTDGNYTLSFVNGALTINKAAATVTANSDLNKTYSGVSQSVNGFTATGLVNNETTSVLTGVSATASGTNAGTYPVIPVGTDGNYTLSFVNGALTINKAAATVAKKVVAAAIPPPPPPILIVMSPAFRSPAGNNAPTFSASPASNNAPASLTFSASPASNNAPASPASPAGNNGPASSGEAGNNTPASPTFSASPANNNAPASSGEADNNAPASPAFSASLDSKSDI